MQWMVAQFPDLDLILIWATLSVSHAYMVQGVGQILGQSLYIEPGSPHSLCLSFPGSSIPSLVSGGCGHANLYPLLLQKDYGFPIRASAALHHSEITALPQTKLQNFASGTHPMPVLSAFWLPSKICLLLITL